MKKLTALFLSTLMVLTLVISMATFAVSADTVTADTSWYDASKTDFTITTPAQLLGFAALLNEGTTFEGKTIKLGNDITMNAGFDGNKPEDATNLVKYSTISEKEFHGTFDGQNHAIIGLYMDQVSTRQGIFGNIMTEGKTATVKNLAIIKSNMCVIGNQICCIFGQVKCTANISNCYVDVNFDFGLQPSADRWGFGGFIAHLYNANAVAHISICVFAGDLNIPNTRAMVAGFIARAENFKTITITNCAMYGNIPTGSSNSVSGFIGRIHNVANSTVTFNNCICAGSGTGISGSFWTPDTNATNPYVQINNSFYATPTYKKSHNNTDVQGDEPIEDSVLKSGVPTGLKAWTIDESLNNGYPLPINVAYMVGHVNEDTAKDGYNTAFAGYQNTDFVNGFSNIRLIGVVNDMNGDGSLDDEYTAVGFEVEMISPKTWNNKTDNDAAPKITTVYSSVLEGETPKSASELGGDYIFVATIKGVKQNVGDVTFVVKTFHDTDDGRVYDDAYVITYNTGAVAS